MRKIFQIASWEFTERIKRKSFILSTLLTPLFIFAIGYFTGLTGSNNIEIPKILGVSNQSTIPFEVLKNTFENQLLENKQPKYILIDTERIITKRNDEGNVLNDLVENGELAACLFLKEDSNSNIKANLLTKYPLSNSEQLLIKNLVSISASIPFDFEVLELNHSLSSNKSGNKNEIVSEFYRGLILIILLIVMVLSSGGMFARGLAEEKSNRIIEILISSCKVKDLLIGKIFGLMFLGLVQLMLWIVISYLMFNKNIFYNSAPSFINQLAFFIAGYFFYSSIFVCFGSLVNSEHDSQQLTTNLSIFLLFPIVASLQIIQAPDSVFAKLLSLFPLTTAPVMMLRLNTIQLPLLEIISTLLILILFTFAFIFLSAKIFSKGILMFGKRPAYYKIFNWLKLK